MCQYLIWVQTVCKGYQQTKKVTASKERAKLGKLIFLFVYFFYLFTYFKLSLQKSLNMLVSHDDIDVLGKIAWVR